jgi:hypothetical protein
MEKLKVILDMLQSHHVDNDTAGHMIFEIANNGWKM